MSFLFINKTLRVNNLKTRAAANANVSVFVIYVEAIIYLLLHNLHDGTFKLLGAHIESRLSFDYHIKQLCEKSSKKLHALSRETNVMNITKTSFLIKSVIRSHCLLVRMLYSKNIENRINRLYERAHRLSYDNSKNLSFRDLSLKEKTAKTYQKIFSYLQ